MSVIASQIDAQSVLNNSAKVALGAPAACPSSPIYYTYATTNPDGTPQFYYQPYCGQQIYYIPSPEVGSDSEISTATREANKKKFCC